MSLQEEGLKTQAQGGLENTHGGGGHLKFKGAGQVLEEPGPDDSQILDFLVRELKQNKSPLFKPHRPDVHGYKDFNRCVVLLLKLGHLH